MEGMDSYHLSTDEGSTSSSKATEGSTADIGRNDGGKRLMDTALESPVASIESPFEEGQFETVAPPTPQNPLAALAVYVDVNFSSAFQMLRTAASAAAEEAKATLFLGGKARLNITKALHRRLEELWIRPYRQLKNVSFDSVRLLLGSLQRQDHRCVVGTPTHANPNGEMPAISCTDEAAASRYTNMEGSSQSSGLPLNRLDQSSSSSEAFPAGSLPAAWRPLCRHDGTFITPPTELLAVFADPGSAHFPPHYSRGCFTPGAQELWMSTQDTTFHSTMGCVVGLCVRSLLDLYIQSIRSLQPALLPKGSVVLVTAVNVPMMFRVLKEHHLIVQPLDLDPHTLMPTEQSLQQSLQCWGSKIKAVLCSHLYGGLCDLQSLVEFCAKHKLLLIEDCAESFVGELYRGHPRADVSLFSFGLIKTCTSAGGGIATVRSKLVAARMRSLQALYPYSSRRTFFKKLCVTFGACILQSEVFMKPFLKFCYMLGWNPGTFLQSFVRGFPSTGELFKLLRCQPSSSLLAVLMKRLDSWNLEEFIGQQLRTTRFARRLQYLGFQIPGSDAAFKTFWLFPIVTPDGWSSSDFEAVLRENGLFAASDATTLVCCTTLPSGAGGMGYPKTASEVMRRIVYLPVNRNSTQKQLLQVEAAVAKACGCEPNMRMRSNARCIYGDLDNAYCETPHARNGDDVTLARRNSPDDVTQ